MLVPDLLISLKRNQRKIIGTRIVDSYLHQNDYFYYFTDKYFSILYKKCKCIILYSILSTVR